MSNPEGAGALTFAGVATSAYQGGQPVPATGYDFADFLLGLAQSSRIQYGNSDHYLRRKEFALFVNDNWRATSRFTLQWASVINTPLPGSNVTIGLPIWMCPPASTPQKRSPRVAGGAIADSFLELSSKVTGIIWPPVGPGLSAPFRQESFRAQGQLRCFLPR